MLGQERHEVGASVAIEVGHRHVDRARTGIDLAAHEGEGRTLLRHVLEQEDSAHRAPAKGGDDEVGISVAVHVGRFHIGHAGQAPGQDDGLVRAVLLPSEPKHAALLVVLRGHVSEVGHHEIDEAITVEVDRLGVTRVPGVGDHAQPSLRVSRISDHDEARSHVDGHHLEAPRAVEVEETGVGHERHGGPRGEGQAGRQSHGVPDESRGDVRRRPGLGSRQLGRRAIFVVTGELLDVEVERGGRCPPGGTHVGHDVARHLVKHGPPRVTGKHLGRRDRVAGRAGALHHGLGRVGPRPVGQGTPGEDESGDRHEHDARPPHLGGGGSSGWSSLPPTDCGPVRSVRRARSSFKKAARSRAASSFRPTLV